MKVISITAGTGFVVLASFLFVSCRLGEKFKWQRQHRQRPSRRSAESPPPLKIFVMVGQSNMEGHGYMDKIDEDGRFLNGTLEWMVETYPETYGKLKTTDDDASSTWKQRKDVRIAYNRQNLPNVRPVMNSVGPLAAGYGGSEGGQGHEIGPELGFGWTVGDELLGSRAAGDDDEDDAGIFLIKIAWGGRSLAVDYRPPSSGGDQTGLYYEAVLANVYRTLFHLPDLVPGYTRDRGFSLEGFVWHQGWNDGCDENMTAEYESNLANLIRDVRVDLGVPDLPFVVGVSGMNGWNPTDPKRTEIAKAQLAVADASRYPEFAGTVAVAETRNFYREPKPSSPGDQVYHWNNNCESYWLVGRAMGQAMVELVRFRNEKKKKNENEKAAPPPTTTTTRTDRTAPGNGRDDDEEAGWLETMFGGTDVAAAQ